MKRLSVRSFGPVVEADVRFGDLTVFVGPQATGKSIFLQLVKLLVDAGPIRKELLRFGLKWRGLEEFNQLVFGEGMEGLGSAPGFQGAVDGQNFRLESHIKGSSRQQERLFYVPAQRVIALRDGLTRPFTDYRSGDPFVVREFSETLHKLVQQEFGKAGRLFPQPKRLKEALRKRVETSIFNRYELQTDSERLQRRIVLQKKEEVGTQTLPFLVWSAGQREFVPLLMGFYWLMPPTKVSRRGKLEWVVIEEPEMGLHPEAITAVMALVLELLRREYKVLISTHSPHVLDVVWALQTAKNHDGQPADVLKLFGLPTQSQQIANAALKKEYKAFYFARDGQVKDISDLDPGSDSPVEAGWGGLTEFSGRVADVVADLVSRAEKKKGGADA
ncbi:MAG: AAA family ATPase [Acidobacteriota bacterium]